MSRRTVNNRFRGRKISMGTPTPEVLGFTSREARDERWRQLREKGNTKAVRFTTQEGSRMIWCIAY